MARILVIEDNPDSLELMRFLLGAYGHAVIACSDADSGIASARRQAPELILCDIHLPGKDGYQVAREIRQDAQLGDTPLIAVSALVQPDERARGLQAGFDGYIDKPIDPERFCLQVAAFLPLGVHAGRTTGRAGAPAAGAKILLIDDTTAYRGLIAKTLASGGYAVKVSAHVEDALELTQAEFPDLIVCDTCASAADGFDSVRRVNSEPHLAKIPLLVLTTFDRGESERRGALRAGVVRWLMRPFEPQQLLNEVVHCLTEYSGAEHGNDSCR